MGGRGRVGWFFAGMGNGGKRKGRLFFMDMWEALAVFFADMGNGGKGWLFFMDMGEAWAGFLWVMGNGGRVILALGGLPVLVGFKV